MSGCGNRTQLHCSAGSRLSSECSRAMWPTCTSCVSTSTPNADSFSPVMLNESALATSNVLWLPCFRVIPSRYPTIHLFERVAENTDWDALYWIESLTNPRLRDEIGDIELVPREERVFGPGA